MLQSDSPPGLHTIPLSSLFRTSYSLVIRIWHWLTFLVITASIVTVLFASTLFTTRGNISMVQEQVQRKGGTISPDQARAVAHEYSDKLWMLHKYIGFGLCFLFLSRVVIEAGYSKDKRLVVKLKKALRFESQSRIQTNDQRHYVAVKAGYLVFYLLFFVMALTGLGLAFEDVPLFKSAHRTITQVHSFTQYLIYLYIVTHIIGVVIADNKENKGIVSAMINGNPSGQG